MKQSLTRENEKEGRSIQAIGLLAESEERERELSPLTLTIVAAVPAAWNKTTELVYSIRPTQVVSLLISFRILIVIVFTSQFKIF